ncbi:hypothetical protein BS78_07G058100 [Paspalum vaginatum]|nr:hypothetical protein BS78_07G058100 [Paspalum vaginatum]
MLLLLNTVGVAHVLSEDPPSGDDGASPEAAKKWAREDAVCRGHILAALSDRLLPDYARHATGRAVWRAVARTYDVDTPSVSWRKFTELEFKLNDDGGAPSFLEQLAHAEALGHAGQPSLPDLVEYTLGQKLPADVASRATVVLSDGSVKNRISEEDELNVRAAMAEDEEKGFVCCNMGKNITK